MHLILYLDLEAFSQEKKSLIRILASITSGYLSQVGPNANAFQQYQQTVFLTDISLNLKKVSLLI